MCSSATEVFHAYINNKIGFNFPGQSRIPQLVDHNLITSVHYEEAAESYVVPFRSNHPRHVFVNIIECTLLCIRRYSLD